MKLSIHEILELASKTQDPIAKMNAIRLNGSLTLEIILQYALAEHLSFDLPEGTPPYKQERNIPIGMAASNLYQDSRRLYVFLKGNAANMSKPKKELLFIQILEGLHYTEAELLISVKDKTLLDRYPGLSYSFIYEAIPDLLPHPSTLQNVFKDDQIIPKAIEKVEVKQSEDPLVSSPQEQQSPVKVRKGWPLGKPRGPRKPKVQE
jgi:hypothetical protein